MNRRLTVLVERRTTPDAPDPWEPEVEFIYDPGAMTTDDAIDVRPKLDFVGRQLRVTGDYIDAVLKERLKEKVTTS